MGHCRRCRKCVNPRIRVGILKKEALPPDETPSAEAASAEVKAAGKNGEAPETPEIR
jgi:hypothetical protein